MLLSLLGLALVSPPVGEIKQINPQILRGIMRAYCLDTARQLPFCEGRLAPAEQGLQQTPGCCLVLSQGQTGTLCAACELAIELAHLSQQALGQTHDVTIALLETVNTVKLLHVTIPSACAAGQNAGQCWHLILCLSLSQARACWEANRLMLREVSATCCIYGKHCSAKSQALPSQCTPPDHTCLGCHRRLLKRRREEGQMVLGNEGWRSLRGWPRDSSRAGGAPCTRACARTQPGSRVSSKSWACLICLHGTNGLTASQGLCRYAIWQICMPQAACDALREKLQHSAWMAQEWCGGCMLSQRCAGGPLKMHMHRCAQCAAKPCMPPVKGSQPPPVTESAGRPAAGRDCCPAEGVYDPPPVKGSTLTDGMAGSAAPPPEFFTMKSTICSR